MGERKREGGRERERWIDIGREKEREREKTEAGGRRRELEAEEGWLRGVVGAILINCFAVLCTTFLLL